MGLYDKTIGMLLLGAFFNTFLYGLVVYQFAVYYRTKFNDRLVTKYMVLFLFILDTFHTASAIYMAWNYTVTNYNNPAVLAMAEWPFSTTAVDVATAAVVTQVYQGFRIWQLTESKVLYVTVILLAVPGCIMGIFGGIAAGEIKLLSGIQRLTPIAIGWLSMQSAADIFIVGTLITVFSHSRTGFRKTDTVINRLIRGAIQTGVFTSIFSMAALIAFISAPETDICGLFIIPIGRIYTNTLMDTLLARESLKADMAGTYDLGLEPSEWSRVTTVTIQSTDIQLKVQKSDSIQATSDYDCMSAEDSKAV